MAMLNNQMVIDTYDIQVDDDMFGGYVMLLNLIYKWV
jgi:hypothetical protein